MAESMQGLKENPQMWGAVQQPISAETRNHHGMGAEEQK